MLGVKIFERVQRKSSNIAILIHNLNKQNLTPLVRPYPTKPTHFQRKPA